MEIKRIEPRVITYSLCPSKDDKEYHMCMWARFIFDCDNGRLNINSDAGDYSYGWGYNEHEDFMHLMARINKEYLIGKISSCSVFDIEQSKKETIKDLKEYGLLCYGIKNGKRLSEIINAIKEIDNGSSEETFFREVDSLVPEMDWESIQIVKRYPHGAEVVVNLFEKYVQPQIKKDFCI